LAITFYQSFVTVSFFLFKKIGAGLYSPTPNIIEPKEKS